MKKVLIRFMVALISVAHLTVPVFAQSGLPSLGDGAEMSLMAERKLGDRIARELYRDPDYIDDAVLGDYVESIWQRLLTAARQRGELSQDMEDRYAWRILLGRDRSVNAFALPGAYMGVHLGLMAVVSNEDELASVLGHELSHVTQRHIARMVSQQGNQAPLLLGTILLGILAGVTGGANAGAALIVGGQAAAAQGQLNFSRDMEREADRVGYGVMTQAGYEGQGFVTMFEKLEQANRFNDTSAFPYLRSHPLTTERMADMQARLPFGASTTPKPPSEEHAMLSARARVLANADSDSLRAALKQPDSSVYATLPAAQQIGQLYASALAGLQLREFELARRRIEQLQRLMVNKSAALYQVRLLEAELALAMNEPQRVLTVLPSAPFGKEPRAALFLRVRASLQTGQVNVARDMAERLQVWLSSKPQDAQAWQLLSSAYAAQGLTLRALRAEAEAYAAQFNFAAAGDRLKAAQDLVRKGGQNDEIELSIIDTRSRQIASMLREQSLER